MSTTITGSKGFIGKRLMKSIDAKGLKHEDIVYRHSYNCEKLFFLSTYGNMAHHEDYREMLQANIADLVTLLSSYTGWFCYMSSSSVTLPVQTPYSRFKKAGEEIVLGYPNIKACVVRPYTVTGVGEQREHLIPTLIRSCFEGTGMDFVPSATHDYVDVEDVVSGLVRLSEDKATSIHEFGNGMAIENNEVKLLVEEVTGLKANVKEVKPLRVYDNDFWCCRNKSKYWQPTKSLRQSITEMVQEYRNDHA